MGSVTFLADGSMDKVYDFWGIRGKKLRESWVSDEVDEDPCWHQDEVNPGVVTLDSAGTISEASDGTILRELNQDEVNPGVVTLDSAGTISEASDGTILRELNPWVMD